MYSTPLRFAAVLVLALSLCVLSGAVTSVLAVAQTVTYAHSCCPSEPADDRADDCCVSPECQCLSCLTFDLSRVSLTLEGILDADSAHQERTVTLTGGNYRTIDYPPEIA